MSKKQEQEPVNENLQREILKIPSAPMPQTKNIEDLPYFNLPSSFSFSSVDMVLRDGKNKFKAVEKLPESAATIKKSTENPNKIMLEYSRRNTTISIMINDTEAMLRSGASSKIFHVIMTEMLKQTSRGYLWNNTITFPLEKLVELGIYGKIRSARTEFNSFINAITSFKLNCEVKHKGKASDKQSTVPFYHASLKKGQCVIKFDPEVQDWSFLIGVYTKLPTYYYKLTENGAVLLSFICRTMRQRTKDIQDAGCFKIKLSTICQYMLLPMNTKNQGRDIKKPIENAVEEIGKHSENEFKLYIDAPANVSVMEWVNSGYLVIFPTKEFASFIKTIRESGNKKIEAMQKRKEEAAIRAEMKKLENAAKNK